MDIDYKPLLRQYWGFQDLRPMQYKIIASLLESGEVVALLPTGGGKSLCYQLPALMMEGMTIVVSPLISLMEDQVFQLKSRNIAAEYIHSGLSRSNIDRILENAAIGMVKILYVAPERLNTNLFRERMYRANISMVAIDEAHCISQWGHDFRPTYRDIGFFLSDFSISRRMALTASATDKVVAEIKKYLLIPDASVFRSSFYRSNISVNIHRSDDPLNDLLNYVSQVESDKLIIYCRSRRLVETIYRVLRDRGVKVSYYHAGLEYAQKKKIQQEFAENSIQIMVATNAFGMGIDIPNIRHVIHYGVPPSIEEYYQEIGRAGRDGMASQAHLFYLKNDIDTLTGRFKNTFPDFETLCKQFKQLHATHSHPIHEGANRNVPMDYEKIKMSLKCSFREAHGYVTAWQKLGWIELMYDLPMVYSLRINASARDFRMNQMSNNEMAMAEHIMRNYPTVYSEYIDLDIGKVLKATNLTQNEVDLILLQWKKRGEIGLYIQKEGDILRFVLGHARLADYHDYRNVYENLKESEYQRIKSIINFVKSNTCRNQNMMTYFSESIKPCGSCDQCRKTISVKRLSRRELSNLSSVQLQQLYVKAKEEKLTNILTDIQILVDEGILKLSL